MHNHLKPVLVTGFLHSLDNDGEDGCTLREPIIEFIDFSFQYRAQSEPTLHNLSLTIYKGEKVLILGPSGSGKSTLAHCINGLIPHFYPGKTQGSARLTGRDMSSMNLYDRSVQIGTVLQDPDGQFVGMTVAEDIAFQLENEGVPQHRMELRVAEAARNVGMEHLLAASPQALSGGQKQRTTLAGILVSEADVLLFDEPLANLDPHAGRQAIELIDRIHQETGRTIIIVEHRLEDVLHRSVDRILVMADGRFVADARPDELLSDGCLLREVGIREPLYLTALRHAGCAITPDMKPSNLTDLRLAANLPSLQAWYERLPAAANSVDRPAVLELRDIDYSYERGSPLVLNQVSLTVRQGELISIVGCNGAGKSTLSKLICGFLKPTAGRMLYKGQDLVNSTIKERAERIGFVLQNPNHMISKTQLYDEVALGLRLRDIPEPEIKERVHETLRICGLHPFRSWPISALSFGQKKRVTIASILVLRPEVIILDEPTAGQDYRHYNEMMEFLLSLTVTGVSIIVITHDMHLMMEYTQRAIVLAGGEVLADRTPAEVLTDSRLAEAASLKETSIYTLAKRAGIDRPEEFVRRFIAFDRRERNV